MPTFHSIRHTTSEQTPTATRRAYDTLKREILYCELVPGTEIYEGEIAERLGMSKTPVREALGMLVHEGFVDVKPRQGYRVTEITISDVQEVFQMWLLLEPAAAELAAERATPEQLRKMQELAGMDPEAPFEEKVAANTLFHETLADASGNERLAATLRNLLEEVHRFLFLGLGVEDVIGTSVTEHRELLDALLKGNHHLAREIAARHVEEERLRVFDSLLESLASGTASTEPVVLRPTRRRETD